MANSVVKVTDITDDLNTNSLLLLVNKDGPFIQDRRTVEKYLHNKSGPTDLQLMHIDKADSKNIEVIVENLTYMPGDKGADDSNENHYQSIEEIERNLYNFKLDHDYTNKTDPEESQCCDDTDSGPPILDKEEEGVYKDQSPIVITVPPKQSQNLSNTSQTKSFKLSKSVATAASTGIYPGEDSAATANVKARQIKTQKEKNSTRNKKAAVERTETDDSEDDLNSEDEDIDSDDDDDDDEDQQSDDNDSDFSIEHGIGENKRKKAMKKGQLTARTKKQKPVVIKAKKILKSKKELHGDKSSNKSEGKEEKFNEADKTVKQNIEEIVGDNKQQYSEAAKSEEAKCLEKKPPPPKKKKDPPKPIPGDFALFSTPDIIRKVGGEKSSSSGIGEPSALSSPSLKHKSSTDQNRIEPTAKISQESRSKSVNNDQSSSASFSIAINKSNRNSLDGKDKPLDKVTNQKISDGKNKDTDKLKHSKSLEERIIKTDHERRLSENSSDKNVSKERKSISSDSNRRLSDVTKSSLSSSSLKHSLTPQKQTVKVPPSTRQTSDDHQMQALTNPEEFRNIINEDAKTFNANTSLISSDPGSEMAIDGTGLDLDPSILDNINNDMISEDILYQVAQQLVSNTELQNAIDKGINEGVLDTSALQETLNLTTDISNASETAADQPIKQGTQIIRPDGRILVLPPIERPTTRSRNKKKEESLSNSITEQQQPATVHPRELQKTRDNNDDDDDDDADDFDDEGDEEQQSEDDPNRLWCICNQPHNNRFMICCDTCEEWYHGKCVNITKAMGHQMEAEGKEWICSFCKDPSAKRPAAAARRIKKAATRSSKSSSASSVRSSSIKKDKGKSMLCAGCKKPLPAGSKSIYCSDKCILLLAERAEKIVVFERSSGNMLTGNEAPNAANLDQWLKRHPGYEVVRSAGKVLATKSKPTTPSMTQSKLKLVKNANNAGVSLAVQQKGVNIGILKHSEKKSLSEQQQQQQKQQQQSQQQLKLLKIYKKDPSGKVKLIQPQPLPTPTTSRSSSSSSSTPSKSKIQTVLSPSPKISSPSTPSVKTLKKTSSTSTPTTPQQDGKTQTLKIKRKDRLEHSKPQSEEVYRQYVQKDLFTRLLHRLKNSDMKLPEQEVKSISSDIEGELYKCFGNTGVKYKNQYRKLILNIQNEKNQTFWRRICEKAISSYELVRMTHEGMASKELAKWREQEAKRELDNIKKNEIELLRSNRQCVFKTHKGEEVLEDHSTSNTNEIIKSLTEGSTLQVDDDDKKHKDRDHKDKRNSSKHSHKDKKHASRDKKIRNKEHRRHRSSKSSSRDRDRNGRRRHSSRSRDRSKHDRKRDRKSRSRSGGDRDRDRSREKDKNRDSDKRRKSSHKSSRHKKDDLPTDSLDKRSKEILEKLVENRLWKHVSPEDIVPGNAPGDSDSDHEIPSSTTEDQSTPRTPRLELEQQSSSSSTTNGSKNVKQPMELDAQLPPSPPQGSLATSSPPPPVLTPSVQITNKKKVAAVPIWSGTINMVDVAQISITAHEVSGDCVGLNKELSDNLDIVGRISPETVYDYIGKMRCSNSKVISLLKLAATNVEEQMPYLALYSYLSSRNRLGVVKSTNRSVKDFYILPLAPQKAIPQVLLPITGPGFEEPRPALLLGIVVRDKRKRVNYPDPSLSSTIVPPKKPRIGVTVQIQPPRSYTPPPPPVTPPELTPSESTTPPPLPDRISKIASTTLPAIITDLLPSASSSTTNLSTSTSTTKPAIVSEDDEPYSPEDSDPDVSVTEAVPIQQSYSSTISDSSIGSKVYTSIPGLGEAFPLTKLDIQRQMEELNKKIEMQKSEITSITKNIATSGTEISDSVLAKIAIPSDIHQILDSVKRFGVVNSTETKETPPVLEKETPKPVTASDPSSDLTIPLMLSNFHKFPRHNTLDFNNTTTNTIPLNLPLKPKSLNTSRKKSASVLSSLTEEDLIKKAMEEEDAVLKNDNGNEEIYLPPVPGFEN